jgi:hypothetical protein
MSETYQIETDGTDGIYQDFIDAPAGAFVFVNMTTQAEFGYEVFITDNEHRGSDNPYFHGFRQSAIPEPPLIKSFQTEVAGLTVAVKVVGPATANLRIRYSKLDVVSPAGEKIASTSTYLGEDLDDDDWNDVYLTVAWWKHAG